MIRFNPTDCEPISKIIITRRGRTLNTKADPHADVLRSPLCDRGTQLAASHVDKTSTSAQRAPVQLLLKLSDTLITTHAGVTDRSHSYLLICHCDGAGMKTHIGCKCLKRGQKSKKYMLCFEYTEVLGIICQIFQSENA